MTDRKPPVAETVYLSLGSNVDAEKNIRSAVERLRTVYGELKVSPVYKTEAVGFEGDPFINLVVAFEADDSIEDLNRSLKQIEAEHGRSREDERFAPRTLDLDLLMYGDRAGDFDGVVLPRGEILKYAFVLLPLAELAPEVLLPGSTSSLAECWRGFEGDRHGLQLIDFDFNPGDEAEDWY